MQPMDPADLERDIDSALGALPVAAAPPTLLSRVMRDVQAFEDARTAQPARGWLRPWFAWGARAQVSAGLGLLVAAAGLAWFGNDVAAWVQALDATAPVATVRFIWRIIEPAVAGGSIYVLVMGVVVACVAAALSQMALEGTSN